MHFAYCNGLILILPAVCSLTGDIIPVLYLNPPGLEVINNKLFGRSPTLVIKT